MVPQHMTPCSLSFSALWAETAVQDYTQCHRGGNRADFVSLTYKQFSAVRTVTVSTVTV